MNAIQMEICVMEFLMQCVFAKADSVKHLVSNRKCSSLLPYSFDLGGCGVVGAFFKTECSTCNEEDCEDSGACVWDSTTCREIPEALPAKQGISNASRNQN